MSAVLLPPVSLIGHEGFVDGKVFNIGLQNMHNVCLTWNHHQLKTGYRMLEK